MHVFDCGKAISESRRVADRAAFFHSVSVLEKCATNNFSKCADGGKVANVVFHCAELLKELMQCQRHLLGESSHAEIFGCRPTGALP